MLTDTNKTFTEHPEQAIARPSAINLSALPATVARRIASPTIDKRRPVYVRRRGAGYLIDQIFILPVGSDAYGAAEKVLLADGYMLVIGKQP